MKHHPFLHVKIDRQVLSQNQGRFQDLKGGKKYIRGKRELFFTPLTQQKLQFLYITG